MPVYLNLFVSLQLRYEGVVKEALDKAESVKQ